MENNNYNIPQVYDSTREYLYNDDITDVYSTRYNRYDNMFDRYDNRYDNRYDYNDYDRRYDRAYDRNMRYYRYPYCDRYGRCENPIWWMFWPLFFL